MVIFKNLITPPRIKVKTCIYKGNHHYVLGLKAATVKIQQFLW